MKPKSPHHGTQLSLDQVTRDLEHLPILQGWSCDSTNLYQNCFVNSGCCGLDCGCECHCIRGQCQCECHSEGCECDVVTKSTCSRDCASRLECDLGPCPCSTDGTGLCQCTELRKNPKCRDSRCGNCAYHVDQCTVATCPGHVFSNGFIAEMKSIKDETVSMTVSAMYRNTELIEVSQLDNQTNDPTVIWTK